jgi:glycosyltransferase involved in cell wall biosynthesis
MGGPLSKWHRRQRTPLYTVDKDELAAAQAVLREKRVAIFIVAFEAERFIESVLDRIPPALRDLFEEILVIDDSSSDQTYELAIGAVARLGLENTTVLRTPYNRGYGGNQKLGYLHAIKQGFDYVVLLHGDGQYAPEYLPQILTALGRGEPDAVIASRMIDPWEALSGGMPLYKWVGNQVLTAAQNRLLRSRLSEFHSGYRAYKVDALRAIPFGQNTDDFHFDTEVLIQLLITGRTILEIPIPTFYGDEISRVNGMKYAANCLKAVCKVRLAQIGLFYEPKYAGAVDDEKGYRVKEAPNTLHQAILRRGWHPSWRVADLGASRGVLSARVATLVDHVTAVDAKRPPDAGDAEPVELDLNADFSVALGRHQYDCVLALDVIEHLERPEESVQKIGELVRPGGVLLASTGNIAYVVLRLSLAVGQFNYGKRGILDLTHTRLFTIGSFRRLLSDGGFVVKEVYGFGPPIVDMVGDGPALRFVDAVSARMARAWPRLFAYSFLVVAEKAEELEDIYARTLSPDAG